MKKSIKAFNVKGTKQGFNYPSFNTTLTAENEAQAIEKAKTLTPEKDLTFETFPVIVHHITDKLQNDFYPYGYLKTTAFFNIEFSPKKGCRSIFQTINPKNGRLNNPKKSTYCMVKLPCTIDSNGHFDSCGHLDFNGDEAINKGLVFMSDFFECFEPEQIKEITLSIIAMSQLNAKASVIYSGAKWEDLKPFIESSIKNLAQIVKTGDNLFLNSLLDVQGIKALKDPNYNPFTVKNYEIA
jgi:hypothetical protein